MFSTTNQFTTPLPLYEWTLSSVYKNEVLQGNEAVGWLIGRHFDGNGAQSGDAPSGGNGSTGVRYDYVTEVLLIKWKKLLRPGTGVGQCFLHSLWYLRLKFSVIDISHYRIT